MQFVGYFSAAVIVIVIAIAFGAADKRAHRKRFDGDRMNFEVYAPKVYVVLGLVCTVLFAFCIAISIVNMDKDAVHLGIIVIFGVVCAWGVWFLFRSLRWRLTVCETELTLTPTFGRRRNFPVGAVTHIENGRGRVSAYTDKRKLFSVDNRYHGSFALVSYLIEMGVRAPKKIDWGNAN